MIIMAFCVNEIFKRDKVAGTDFGFGDLLFDKLCF